MPVFNQGGLMHAVVFNDQKEFRKIEVKDRFEFEDTFLHALVPPRPCTDYREHHPSPRGVHVFLHPVSHDFEARPYLEFEQEILDETHFQVMQEGRPTGFTVVLG
jgi:hypothetical protein